MIDPNITYVLAVIFIATLVRSTFGFGEALVSVPLLAMRIPVAVAAPLAVLISIVVAAVIIAQDWRHMEIRSASWLIVAALFGIPLGLFFLAKVNDHFVKLILGILIASFSIYSLIGGCRLRLQSDHIGWMLGFGFISGILGGTYGLNGPPLVIYGSLRRWSPQHFRATLQGYFLIASLVGLIGYAALGMWTPIVTRHFLFSLPCVFIAIPIGRALNHRLRDDRFFRLVYVGLIVIALILVTQEIR